MLKAERGLFEVRQGRPVLVTGGPDDGRVVLAPVEGLGPDVLAALAAWGRGPASLVVTRHRASAMGLVGTAASNGSSNGAGPEGGTSWSLPLGDGIDPARTLLLATEPGAAPPDLAGARPSGRLEDAGLLLARLGRLLPAVVAVEAAPPGPPGSPAAVDEALAAGTLLAVPADEIEELAGAPGLEVSHVSEAPVPLPETENARFLLFRETRGFFEHVAIVIGDADGWPDPVPVRLHSACLTGDLFGSLRCDCGEQLHTSLRSMAEGGGGVLLYLEQEGRGIGLGNKLRAYSLQEEGLDTVDADGSLGFGADERRYDSAVEILHRLGVRRVRLLTNNPDKVRAVREGGIEVVERQPLHGTLTRHNLPYVRAKIRRSGHWLEEMLARALPGD